MFTQAEMLTDMSVNIYMCWLNSSLPKKKKSEYIVSKSKEWKIIGGMFNASNRNEKEKTSLR